MEVADPEVTKLDHSFGEEAREWLAIVCAAMEKTPAGKLFSLLQPSITVQLVNQAKAFIEDAFHWQASNKHSSSTSDQAPYLSRCALYIYYRVLQGLLCDADKQTKTAGTSDARVVALASNQPLQLALLTCAVEVTCFCSTGVPSFPCIASALGQALAALEVWEAAHHFLRYLGPETAVPLAESVASYLMFMRIRVTEDLAWRTGSTLYSSICCGGGGSSEQGDYALLTAFLDSLAVLSSSRVTATAAGVTLHTTALNQAADFSGDCVWLMKAVLREHLDLLFNQHLSSIVACCVYSIARAHGIALPFKKVVDTIMCTFPHHSAEDFRHAEVHPGNGRFQPQYGDTRQLYNQVFLPRMDMLVQQKFPGMEQNSQDASASNSKQQRKPGRQPLKSLSATDINTRSSRFGRMQA